MGQLRTANKRRNRAAVRVRTTLKRDATVVPPAKKAAKV